MTAVGTRVQATLWEVHYRTLNPERELPPEPRSRSQFSTNPVIAQMQAQVAAEASNPNPHVMGRAFVITADPTGADLLHVARRAVLGAGGPDHEFSIVAVQRMGDVVRGTALLEGGAS